MRAAIGIGWTRISRLVTSPSPRIFRLLIVLLWLAGIVSLSIGVKNAYYGSQDFQWSPTKLFVEGKNPYKTVLSGDDKKEIILSQFPNYLSPLYVVIYPFGYMDFKVAKISWAVLNICLSILCVYLICYFTKSKNLFIYLLPIFWFSLPFRNGLGNGQQQILILTFLCAFAFQMRNPKYIVLISLSYIKYSFAPSFFAFGARHNPLYAIISIPLLFVMMAVSLSMVDGSLTEKWLGPFLVASQSVGEGNGDLATILFRYVIFEPSFNYKISIYVILAVSNFAINYFLIRNEEDILLNLSISCVCSLLFLKHLGYDGVFLIIPLLYFMKYISPRGILGMTIIFYFWYFRKALDVLFGVDVTKETLLLNFALLVLTIFLLKSDEKPVPIAR